jgi:hypothetical protein
MTVLPEKLVDGFNFALAKGQKTCAAKWPDALEGFWARYYLQRIHY